MNVDVIEINPREIVLLEDNARYMTHKEFMRLVDNVKRDGQLSSAPFLCLEHNGKDKGKYKCLSGNHRTMAAIEAGIENIVCLKTDDELSDEQKTAIQLSHNAITGQDDIATLKALYENISDVELKQYAGLDDAQLELLEKLSTSSISEASLEFQTLSVVFLPDDLEKAKSVIEKAIEQTKNSDNVWLAKMSEYDRWLDAQEVSASSHGIKNAATAIGIVLSVFEDNMHTLSEAWENAQGRERWVPIESIIGRSKVPVESAKVIKQAVDKLVGQNDLTSKNMWQALEYLAAEYLSGN